MFHRLISLMVGVLVVWTIFKAWQFREERPLISKIGLVLGGAFLAQVLIGAANVWLEFPPSGEVLHLATASLVWAILVTMAALSYIPGIHQRKSLLS